MKRIVIMGATSGIGLETAKRCIAAGWRVGAAGRAGAGVGAAVEFSLALTEALFGFETAGKIRKSIVAD